MDFCFFGTNWSDQFAKSFRYTAKDGRPRGMAPERQGEGMDLTKQNSDRMAMIHTGDEYDRYLNAVVPPVFMNSLHAFDSMEDYYAVDLFSDDQFVYGRDGNPTVRILERKLAQLEHGRRAVV